MNPDLDERHELSLSGPSSLMPPPPPPSPLLRDRIIYEHGHIRESFRDVTTVKEKENSESFVNTLDTVHLYWVYSLSGLGNVEVQRVHTSFQRPFNIPVLA